MRFRIKKATLLSLAAITILALCGLFSTHCKKFDISRQVIVKTVEISNVTVSSCRATGALLDLGESGVTQHGFCWSRSPDPAGAIDYKSQGPANERGAFFDVIEGLLPGTKYYIWAFATPGEGWVYGEAHEFTTVAAQLPEVETGGVVNVTPTSAQCEYNVVSNGGAEVMERGLCWNTEPGPTIDDAHTTEGTGTGAFTGTMNELSPETEYYVRAFAINAVGVAYGDQRMFATPPEAVVPTVHTDPVAEKTATTALVSGSISDDGGSIIEAKGICWNTEPDPTLENNVLNAGNGPAPFELTIEGLTPNTTYFVRAFAANSAGTGYGELQEFTTNPESLVDERDGKIYQTVRIGEQVWMAQNLDHGEMISEGTAASDNDAVEKYCYGNALVNCELYGGLYFWPELMQYNPVEMSRGVCPEGWHVPSDEEWKVLERTLGMTQADADAVGARGPGIGGMLKDPGTTFWNDPNTGATNESGFGARGSGAYTPGGFYGIKDMTAFWTSSLIEPQPWIRGLSNISSEINRQADDNGQAFPVRCVKD